MVANKSKLPPRFIGYLFVRPCSRNDLSERKCFLQLKIILWIEKWGGAGWVGVLCQLTHVCNAKFLKKKKCRAGRGLRHWGERWEGGKAVHAVGVRGLKYWNKMNLRTNWDHDAILDSSTTKKAEWQRRWLEHVSQHTKAAQTRQRALIGHICVDRDVDPPGTWHPDPLTTLGMGDKLGGGGGGGDHFLARISQQRARIQTQRILAHSASLSFYY